MKTENIKFNSHLNHNPNCDILVYQLNKDESITYGVYLNKESKGIEFLEYYKGLNYNVNSTLKSYSKLYNHEWQVPKKYKSLWLELKAYYLQNHKNI